MSELRQTSTPIDVFITDELRRRQPKTTDYLKEKLAQQDLARQMSDHPAEVLPQPPRASDALLGLALEADRFVPTVADEHRHDLNREVEDCLTHRLGLSGDVGRVVSP